MNNNFSPFQLVIRLLFSLAVGLSFNTVSAQPYSMFGPSEIDLSSCNPNGPTGTVSVSFWVLRGPTIKGPTDIQFNNLPPDVHVVFSPAKLTYPGWVTGEQVTATFTANAGVNFPDQVIEIKASDGINQVTNQIILHGTCPRNNRDFTIRGSFLSQNLGVTFPVEGALVEIYRETWLSDQHVGSVRTDDNGNFEAHLWANDEDTYYAKLVLNDVQGVYLHEWYSSSAKDYNSAVRGSNRDPVIDLGGTMIIRDGGSGTPHTAVWQGSRAAYQEFTSTVGMPPPIGDYEIVIQYVLECWTARSTTNWRDGTKTVKFTNTVPIAPGGMGFRPYFTQFNNYSVNFHEFGHALRHTVDGNQRHFTDDASRWTYGRSHGFCGSAPGYIETEAFAFNEGWAEYWERTFASGNCPNPNLADMTNEGAVAVDILGLSQLLTDCLPVVGANEIEREKIRRRSMYSVINRGQNIMHSQGEFRSNFSQQFPACVLPPPGQIPPPVQTLAGTHILGIFSLEEAAAAMSEKMERNSSYITQLKRELNSAKNDLKEKNKNFAGDCDSCITTLVRPAIIQGKLEYAQLLGKTYNKHYNFIKEKKPGTNDFEKVDNEIKKAAVSFDARLKVITKNAYKESIACIKKYSRNSNAATVQNNIAYFERKIKMLEINTPRNNEAYILTTLPNQMNADKTSLLPKSGKDVKY